MGLFSRLISGFQDVVKEIAADAETAVNRLTTTDQLNRVVAAAVLLSYADGSADTDEKAKALKAIQLKLPHFSNQDIAKSWANADGIMSLGFDFGKPDLLKIISGAAGDHDESDLLVRVSILVGGADGDFDDDEKAVVREIITTLGLKTSDYGL